jgi:hypothetical protein
MLGAKIDRIYGNCVYCEIMLLCVLMVHDEPATFYRTVRKAKIINFK